MTKKKILIIICSLAILLSLFLCFNVTTCNEKDEIIKYVYTNKQGEISYFEVNFTDETYTYKGNGFYSKESGLMLRPGTSYSISDSIYHVTTVNGNYEYHFHNHPWNLEYKFIVSSDKTCLSAGLIYKFYKEGNKKTSSPKPSTSKTSSSYVSNSLNSSSSSTISSNNSIYYSSVTFDYGSYKPTETFNVETGSSILLPTVEREGYTFNGWQVYYYSNNLINGNEQYVVTQNVTLYAKWTLDTYTITYNLNGGNFNNVSYKETFTINDLPYVLPVAQYSESMTFSKWTTDENGTEDITKITTLSNYTLYAHYQDVNSCFVFVYDESIEGYSLIGFTGTNHYVTIPSTYNEKPVKQIAEKAFYGNDYVSNVIIGDSITSIGIYAFYDCDNLTSIEIPNSVTSIGSYAFWDCSNLTSIEIPNSVTSIGEETFYRCSNLTSIEIPNSVTSIGRVAFYGCSNLTSIEIPNSVTSIEYDAFAFCYNLTSVNYLGDINDWVQKDFGSGTFFGSTYSEETNLYINGELVTNANITTATSINEGAFSKCRNLTNITIGNSVTSIGHSAFSECTNLTSVTIGNNVTSIESSTFSGCSNLTSVTIPNSVTSIGRYAFSGCSNLTSVTIPNSVTSIGEYAFSNCTNLANVVFENKEGWYVSTSSTATSGTNIASTVLEDSSAAAIYLKNTYRDYYWFKK